ncbi:hypothetical protein DQ384_30890 [Sphaerisporangium album]|uniref:WD40 repeat domain-containing protein n=1 Tax=Sphaerisporangium album TaxID=509200 RepID=A0A367F8B1_9ACTN|nr:hypothetical protein [Sphaerisporangium album]RCG25917.1 hypothetical protein DQ384_30890 [Sphaerisporangium album]
MNDDIIRRLRDAATAVGDTVGDVPGLRLSAAVERPEPRRSKSWLVPVVAAASVIAAITAGAVAVRAGTGSQVAAAGPVAAPKFFLVASTGSLSVRGMDGEQIASVPAPSKDETFWAAQAAADNRRFYVSTTGPDCQGHFYRLTVDESGAAQAFDRLPITPPEGTAAYSLAVSGDGSKLAYAAEPCRAGARTSSLSVADTASGETRTWKASEGKIIGNVAMSGDGRYVAYQYPILARVYRINTAEGGARFQLEDPGKAPGPGASADGIVVVPAPGDVTAVPAVPAVPPDGATIAPAPPSGGTIAPAPPSGDGTAVPAPPPGAITLEPAIPPSGTPKPGTPGYGTGERPNSDTATPPPLVRTTRGVPSSPGVPRSASEPSSPGVPGSASEPSSGPEVVPADPAVPTTPATAVPLVSATAVPVDPRVVDRGPGAGKPSTVPMGRVEMAPDSPDVYVIDTTVAGEDLGTSRKITLGAEAVGGKGGLQGYRLNADGSRIIASLGRIVHTVKGAKGEVEPSTAAIVRFDASDGRLVDTIYKDEKGAMRLLAADGAAERFIVRRGDEIAAVTATGYEVLTPDVHSFPSVTW